MVIHDGEKTGKIFAQKFAGRSSGRPDGGSPARLVTIFEIFQPESKYYSPGRPGRNQALRLD